MEWTTEHFESLSWHDTHFHGFQIVRNLEENAGTADLIFDIDYIVAWTQQGKSLGFTLSQAILTFSEASDLRLELDYPSVSAGMCEFSIDGIERQPLEYATGYKSWRWLLKINWPRGSVAFDAPRFSLRLIGEHHHQVGKQSLDPKDRIALRP